METARLMLLPATQEYLQALLEGEAIFESRFGLKIVEGYVEFPGVIQYSLALLQSGAAPADWSTHLFIHRQHRALIGLGGYKGAPDGQGWVEIGYGIAPAYRGQGYATEAARGLIESAFQTKQVSGVMAHTMAEENASVAVLRKCGFHMTREVVDPEDGTLWHWELIRPPIHAAYE